MFKKTVLAVSMSALLCGCTTPLMEPVRRGVSEVDHSVDNSLNQLRRGESSSSDLVPTIKHVDNAWLPVTKIDVHSQAAETALGRMVAVNTSFNDVKEAGFYLTRLTGIPVLVSAAAAATSATSAPKTESSPAGSAPITTPPSSSSSTTESEATPVIYSGTFGGLLDLVCSRYGVFWEWNNNSINIFKTKTKSFRLAALPGDTSMSSTISSKNSGTESGSGTSSGSSSNSDSDSSKSEMEASVKFSGMSVWTGIKENLEQMLSPQGRLSVTPATGTITVDDTPVVLERVERFVNEQNISLSRQVVINVRVLSVALTNSQEYGINWNVVYRNLSKEIGADLGSNFAQDATASKLTFRVLPNSIWNGSTAIIDALSTQGRVSQVTSASMVTINNQPAPIQVGRQIGYLASSTTTLNSNAGSTQVSLTPGQINTGFSMSVLPHILDNSQLMLQYSGSLSSLNDLKSVDSGTATIQTPDMDVRSFLQRVILNSGETLVVAGFEQFDLNGKTQGSAGAENAMLGGGINTKNDRNVIVVLVQPVLMSGNK